MFSFLKKSFGLPDIYLQISWYLEKYSIEQAVPQMYMAAQSALVRVLNNAPKGCYDVVKKRINALLTTFYQVNCIFYLVYSCIDNIDFMRIFMYVLQFMESDEPDQQFLSYSLKSLSAVLALLEPSDVGILHNFMDFLLKLVVCENGEGREDILSAIVDIIPLLRNQMQQHLHSLIPYLKTAILAPTCDEVLSLIIEIISEVFCVLQKESVKYLKDFIEPLLVLMENDDLDLKIRADGIGLLYDMASNAGLDNFHQYLVSFYCHLERVAAIVSSDATARVCIFKKVFVLIRFF